MNAVQAKDNKNDKNAWAYKPPASMTTEEVLKKQNTIVILLFICVIIATGFLCIKLVVNYSTMNAKNAQLRLLTNYDTSSANNNTTTQSRMINRRTIDDIITTNEEITSEKERYEWYFKLLHAPYDNFMQYLYLPRLNIWKNPYTNEIDTTLIGRNFLEVNPYTDLFLITRWSDYFKDVWDSSQFNEISNITINPIEEDVSWLYKIPLSLSFISPNRRSFLLLVEKISTTSNKENVALLNEFMHHVWETLKKEYKDDIDAIRWPWDMEQVDTIDIDRKLWYYLYSRLNDKVAWIEGMPTKDLVTEEIIDEAIKVAAWCKVAKTERCYYQFRNKFRSIPYLAYSLADVWVNKVWALKSFLKNIPPILKIQEFTFDQARSSTLLTNTTEFNGQVKLDIYGKWVPEEDVTQIAQELWKKCFTDARTLTTTDAIDKIKQNITAIWEIDSVNATKSKELQELQAIIETIDAWFVWYTNYTKIVKLFETYRMISDASVCDF